jgi:hypothetical protein
MLTNRAGNELVYQPDADRPPAFTDEEQARQGSPEKTAASKGLRQPQVEPFNGPEPSLGGSTDVAEVSWFTPTAVLVIAAAPPGRAWPPLVDGGLLRHVDRPPAPPDGSQVLSATCLDLLSAADHYPEDVGEWRR